jgi:hypothetical protein
MKSKISVNEAATIYLKSQQLLNSDLRKGKAGALEVIQHLGYVQIDTLAVVARAHHHTLWSRADGYKEHYLDELLSKDKTIFEYWSHAASYLPMNDYRFSLPRKKIFAEGKSHWFEQDKKMKKYVLDKVKAEGELQSKDFEDKIKRPGMWNWKPAKKSLEQLFMEGKLMVAKRKGFQKVYDLTERVLPKVVNTKYPSEKEMAEHLIRMAIQSSGIVNESEIAYLRGNIKQSVVKTMKRLIKDGEILEVEIEGIEKSKFITTKEKILTADKITEDNYLNILSPFDNAVIQRKRLQSFFNFDYMIECYLPEAKRKYGYFTLPVLYNNNFVARFDPKADRAEKTFYIKSIHFEKGFKTNETFNNLFADKVKAFATFNGCESLIISQADAKWKKEMKGLLKM